MNEYYSFILIKYIQVIITIQSVLIIRIYNKLIKLNIKFRFLICFQTRESKTVGNHINGNLLFQQTSTALELHTLLREQINGCEF